MDRHQRLVVSLGLVVLLAAVVLNRVVGQDASPVAGGVPRAGALPDAELPYRDARLPVRDRVSDLLGRMTLEEKAGQMTQAERARLAGAPDLVTSLNLGSVLSGGGSAPEPNTPTAWADMIDELQRAALATRLGIPLIYGSDAVHGHNNLLGATVFPHNIGLGATRDPELVERIAHATATETRATGVTWTFAPCLCVTRDARWGRSYESFGEDPELVTSMTTAVDGFQGPGASRLADTDRVLATSKHFLGDGDTAYGTSATSGSTGFTRSTGSTNYTVDQGVTTTTEADLRRVDLAPYAAAVRRGTGTVMTSFSSVALDGAAAVNMHGHRDLVTGVLKGELGFDGFVVSDWEGVSHLPGDRAAQVRTAVNAGLDMFMEPEDYAEFGRTLIAEVRAGRVPLARVDDAVRRILTRKFQLGLFEHPFTDRRAQARIGAPEHRALAREAVARSQVLLRNRGDVLPLSPQARVYVAGTAADDVGTASGGWTVTWQGFAGNEGHRGTSVLSGLRQVAPRAPITYSPDGSAPVAGHDVAVVVVGEPPYAEGYGDVGGPVWQGDPADRGRPRPPVSLELQPGDARVVDRVCGAVPRCVVLVLSGRPQVIGDGRLERIDGLVAGWLPGSEGAGVADVLFGRRGFTGRLPVTWPASAAQEPINAGDPDYRPAFPYGWGLTTRPRPPERPASAPSTR